MNSLNFDFRDGCLRVLAAKDSSVKYSAIIKDFPGGGLKSAQGKLAAAIKDAGGKKGRISVVLPGDIIKSRIFQTPAMDIEDAGKIIKREISKELKTQKFVFSIRRLVKDGAGKQDFAAEYALASDLIKYIDMLKVCGVRPDIMISGLEANLHLFNHIRPVTEGNEAVIDIGPDFVEIVFFNNSKLVEYEKIPITLSDDRTPAEDIPVEQKEKMKTYKIIDVLYNFLMASGRKSPEEKPSTLWLCGLSSTIEGITESISNGIGINCKLLNPFDASVNNGSAFTALSEVSAVSGKDIFKNLIPEHLLEERTRLLKRSLLAASLGFYIILIAGGYVMLSRTENDLSDLLKEKEKAAQMLRSAESGKTDIYSSNKDALAKITSGSPILYPVFRDIANLTPAGVSLSSMEIAKSQDITTLKLEAAIQYRDDNFKNAALSKFPASLDSSAKLRRMSAPEITTPKLTGKQNLIKINVSYEVVQ